MFRKVNPFQQLGIRLDVSLMRTMQSTVPLLLGGVDAGKVLSLELVLGLNTVH
jgi:hypothetical protein